MRRSVIGDDFEKKETVPLLRPSKRKLEQSRKVTGIVLTVSYAQNLTAVHVYSQAQQEKTTSPQWFDMPAPEMTQELKNDLKVLQMRNAIERSQHYRASDWKKGLPKHFQVS